LAISKNTANLFIPNLNEVLKMQKLTLGLFVPAVALLLASSSAYAQQGITKEQVDALKAQPCFAKIDQEKFNALAEQYKSARDNLLALCGSGKTEEAQELAFDLADAFEDATVLDDVAKCGEVGAAIVDKFDNFINTFGLGEEGEEPPAICELANKAE
jgi:hypothetical protein